MTVGLALLAALLGFLAGWRCKRRYLYHRIRICSPEFPRLHNKVLQVEFSNHPRTNFVRCRYLLLGARFITLTTPELDFIQQLMQPYHTFEIKTKAVHSGRWLEG